MPPVPPIPLLKRRARLLAHRETISLHVALDRVAQMEGFARWSLLAFQAAHAESPAPASPSPGTPLPTLLPNLVEGDLLLIGARPGQGKTLLGLTLLLEAAEAGRRAVFFTLEYTEAETQARLAKLTGSADGPISAMSARGIEIVTSDDISAATIEDHLEGAPRGTMAVIDYLQILDQDRRKPPLSEQVDGLRHFARRRGFVLAVLSQIDRRFDPARAELPTMEHVRLPNPVATEVFTKTCFLHAGQARFGGAS